MPDIYKYDGRDVLDKLIQMIDKVSADETQNAANLKSCKTLIEAIQGCFVTEFSAVWDVLLRESLTEKDKKPL